ncbi:MAG: serine/threonine-protein kinase [Celeribacter sp.]|jgi:serine/threonine-protein kinase
MRGTNVSSGSNTGIFQIGDVLNNTYRIDKVLGRGGTSEVYLAKSEISGRLVALKALRLELSRNEDFLALMTREEDMREIRHDAIVRYYDNQRTEDGHVYLVMDYVEGPGLDRKIKEGGMSAEDLMIVCERVAEGLVAAHKKNIVHRDLSPDNIILRHGNPADPVIIDFGIAKDTNPGAETIVGNEFAGKYAYAAPEQLSGQTDARADIYALGALLLSTFRGKAPNIGNNPMEVVQNKAKPLDTAGVPEPLKSLIDHMTQPDREHRLQTAQDVVDEIRNPQMGSMLADDLFDDFDDAGEKTVIVPRSVAETASAKDETASAPKQSTQKGTVPPASKPNSKDTAKKTGGKVIPVVIAAFVVVAAIGLFVSGVFNRAPSYEGADPYTLIVTQDADGWVDAVGYVPSEATASSIQEYMSPTVGPSNLTLASGEIAKTWGDDIVRLIGAIDILPEWRLVANANQVRLTGLTFDATQQNAVISLLSQAEFFGGLDVSFDIELGSQFLSVDALNPILSEYQNCGELMLVDTPVTGYGEDSQVIVFGRVADIASRVGLSDALSDMIGKRDLVLDVEVLNSTLCLIDSMLPNAPEGGFAIDFKMGEDGTSNASGHYFVGENPVIDVSIPADVTSGYMFVSALDVSGNVFHLLPNLLIEDNSISTLRSGQDGPVSVRVAYSLADAADGSKLAFVVDDTALGVTKIVVIHSDEPIFDGLRPTTESAQGYANALSERVGVVTSLDSRILTTAQK